MRIGQVDGQRRGLPLRREMDETPLRERVREHPRRADAGADAQQRRAAQRIQVRGADARADRDAARLAGHRMAQRQLVAVIRAQRQPRQRGQRIGLGGHRRTVQHGRRGHHEARHLRQPDRDHAGIGRLADLDRTVDAAADEIPHFVLQQPFDRHARIVGQEARERRDETLLPERMRHRDPQQPLGLLLRAAQVGFERRPARQQLLRALEAALAVDGEPHRVRRPLQQPHAERALERLQPAADRRLGRVQLRGRRGQAARFDYAHEGFHQLKSIPGALHRIGAMVLKALSSGSFRMLFIHTPSV